MITRISQLAVRNWHAVLAATALFAVYGYHAFRELPIEAFPDVTDPMVEIVAVYPGQAAEEVERRVTLEIERAVAGTPGTIDMRSVSVFGLALVRLTFDENGTDFERRTLVSERLRDAELPEGAEVSIGPQATPVGQIYRYTLEGPRSLRELRAIQDFVVERRLRAVPGVADVVTFGGFERQYQVRIDPARLAATGVSVQEIFDAIAATNTSAGGGYVRIGAQEFVVRGLGTALDATDLGQAVVREADGVPVRVSDVADIVEGSTPRRGSVGRGHRDEVVEGIVLLRRGENPSVVLDALRERIATLNDSVLPPDVRMVTFYDRSTLVSATLHTVGHNLIEGLCLVLFVVYLFLRSFRALVILAIVIPVSMLTAFVGIHAMGLPANLISLGAIDFGILVDGAIIVVEATLHALHRPRALGETKGDVIERAVQSVAKPVAFAMLIIIVALGPIFTLQRVEGRIFAPMAFTYAFALLGALLCAMLVVPALESWIMSNDVAAGEPRWIAYLADRYRDALARVRPIRFVVLGVALAGAVGLGAYAAGIGTEFLPELDEGGFYITAIFPSTISLDETRVRASDVRERLLALPEVTDVLSHVGRPEHATQAEGPNNIEFFVALAPEDRWRAGVTREALEHEMRASLGEIPGVQYNFSQQITDRVFETISGIIGQVVVKVHGTDLERMQASAERIRDALAHVDGVTDLALYQAGEVPQLRIEVDREALGRRGLSVDDVQQTIGMALGGAVATELWDGERHYDVSLRLPEAVRADPEALGHLTVGDPDRQITLGEVAHIELARGRGAIWREDFSRFLAVKFNVRGRDLGSTVADAQRAVDALGREDGIYVTWSGEFENQARALNRLAITLPLALLGILGVLYLNFRRFRPTLLILGFLPFAVIAAIAGLRLAGENFSVSGAVGCIALLGQMVLAGVMLCSRIDEARAQDEEDPLLAGARVAFRPVLLTTALALFGLIPAATSHAMGSETQRPFAIAIVAGLLLAMPVVLFLLPVLYTGAAPRPAPPPPEPAVPEEPKAEPEVFGTGELARKIAPVLLALALLVPAPARAQSDAAAPPVPDIVPPAPTQTFTVDQAIDAMAAGNVLLSEAEHRERAAEADVTTAGLWTNPVLSGDYYYGVVQSSYDPAGTGVFSLSQMLETSDVPGARAHAMREELAAVHEERGAVRALLELAVRSACIDLAAAYAAVDVARDSAAMLEASQRIVDARVAGGAAPRYDAHRIAIARAEAVALVDQSEADIIRARAALDAAVGPEASRLVGRPAIDLDVLPTLPDLASLRERLEGSRADLRAARARARSAAAEVDVAQRSVFPGFAVRLQTGFGQGPGQFDLGLGVSLPLPILDFGQGTIPAAEQRADALRDQADAIAYVAGVRLEAAHREAAQRLEAASRFTDSVTTIGPDMRAEMGAAYREARVSILELVDAYVSTREAALERIALTRQALQALVEIERALRVGGPDDR